MKKIKTNWIGNEAIMALMMAAALSVSPTDDFNHNLDKFEIQ